MKRYNMQRYLFVFAGITALFIFIWWFTIRFFTSFLTSGVGGVLTKEDIFLNIMGPNGNFINPMNIVVLFSALYIFGINFVFLTEKASFVTRLKSRKTYVTQNLINILVFSAVFVFLLEAVNICGAFITFGIDMINNFKLIQYSLIDFLSLLLFYIRVGTLLFIISIITNRKIAPFITLAIYIVEFFSTYIFPTVIGVWLPYKDAISVIYLLTNEMQPIDIVLIIIRGLIINLILILTSYFLFSKKDIINYEKNKIIVFFIFVVSVFLQISVFCNSASSNYENGFAIGIPNTDKYYDVGISLIYVLVPVSFILFIFSGSVSNITNGYGKLLIVRNYSKTKLILKQCLINSTILIFLVLFQCVAFWFFNKFLLPVENGMLQSILLYYVILCGVIMLQCLLELFFSAQIASIILFIYCFVSYYIAQVATSTENYIIKVLLFPCLMFGMQNGATDANNIYYFYLIAGLLLNLLFIIICIRKFKKIDIF